MSKYTKLREYLTVKTNETLVTEGSGVFGFFGGFGVWFNRFNDKKDPSDPIEKELLKQEEAAETDAEKRLAALEKAKENAIVAKLQAKAAAKKNKLDLANKRKIDEWKAKQRKAQKIRDYWKENKVERSSAEINVINDELDRAFKDLGDTEYRSEADKIKDLVKFVSYDNDNNPRKPEDIVAIMKKKEEDCSEEELAIRSHMKEIHEYAKKNQKNIVDEIQDSAGVQQLLGKMESSEATRNELQEQIRNGENYLAEWEETAEAVKKVNKLIDESTKAKEALENANEALETFENPEDGIGLKKNEGNAPSLSDDNKDSVSDYLISCLTKEAATGGKLDGKTGEDLQKAVREVLTANGVPAELAEKIMPNLKYTSNTILDVNKTVSTYITEHISENVDDNTGKSELEQLCGGINKKLKTKYENLTNAVTRAQEKYDSKKFDPANEDSVNSISDPDTKAAVERYNAITANANDQDNPELAGLSPNDYLNKDKKKEMVEEPLKHAKHELSAIDAADEKRKLEIAEARARVNAATAEERTPEEIKKATDKILEKEPALGEEYNKDGKLGYYDADGKFHEKPEVGSDNEDEYAAGLENALLMKPIAKSEQKKITNIETIKDNGGNVKGYKVTYSDGTSAGTDSEPLSAEDVAKQKANIKLHAKIKAAQEKKKGDVADALLKLVDDNGTFDLTDAAAEEKAYVEMIVSMSKQERKKFLDGLDIGNTSLKNIEKAIAAENDSESDDTGEDQEVDDEIDANAGDEGDDVKNGKLVHPSKIWKRRVGKDGPLKGKKLKSYEKKDDPDVHISEKEYKARVARFEKRKAKIQNDSFHYTNLGNHLFESINEVEITVKTYTKLSKYLSNNVN